MTLETTLTDITQHLDDWQGINEAQTAQAIVLRILHALGYDIWNPLEVIPESSGNSGYRPDYTVELNGDVRFIVEVKHLGRNLADTDKDMNQAVSYVSIKGKRWAILTNGQEWLFVDNDIRGEPSQKHALTINLKRHAKHAAGYLERLLGKTHWQKRDAEDALAPIIQDIRADIQKRLELGKIAKKLVEKIGDGFSQDKRGVEMAVQYVLDGNERQLAEDNLEHLVKRLLSTTDIENSQMVTVPDRLQERVEHSHAEPHETKHSTTYTEPKKTPNSVERAIIDGIMRFQDRISNRATDITVWLGDESLEVASWRDVHAGLAEALLMLDESEALESLTQIYKNTNERQKSNGRTYPKSSYRQLSNGRFIFMNAGASDHRKRITDMLTHLNVASESMQIVYRNVTYSLP